MPSGKKINWSAYDDLIRIELPKTTIASFRNKFLKHISAKAIGARARKLGIKPAKKSKLDERHKKTISESLMKETPELINKIKELRDRNSTKEIAKILGCSISLVNRIIKRQNIKLSKEGKIRVRTQISSKQKGKIPWNKGMEMPLEFRIKVAISRQKQSGRLSKIQQSFYRTLDELGVNYLEETNEKCRFGPWTFDCRIIEPGYDILVEVQGGYIHSLPKNIHKDEAKATYMRRYFPDIPIKYIWEHEFGAANRIKMKVLQWIGRRNIEQVDFNFRDVTISYIETSEAREFVSAFHYLEKMVGKTCIGAKLGDKIIAVSVWGAPTRYETASRLNVKLNRCLELRRFVVHDAYHKKNFASWFLARSIPLLQGPEVLVSFADVGFGHHGTIYKANNWEYDGMTEPSYFYIDQDGYVILKKTLYNQARKMHMTESDFAETYNYRKVPTPGKKRFIKRL